MPPLTGTARGWDPVLLFQLFSTPFFLLKAQIYVSTPKAGEVGLVWRLSEPLTLSARARCQLRPALWLPEVPGARAGFRQT